MHLRGCWRTEWGGGTGEEQGSEITPISQGHFDGGLTWRLEGFGEDGKRFRYNSV